MATNIGPRLSSIENYQCLFCWVDWAGRLLSLRTSKCSPTIRNYPRRSSMIKKCISRGTLGRKNFSLKNLYFATRMVWHSWHMHVSWFVVHSWIIFFVHDGRSSCKANLRWDIEIHRRSKIKSNWHEAIEPNAHHYNHVSSGDPTICRPSFSGNSRWIKWWYGGRPGIGS